MGDSPFPNDSSRCQFGKRPPKRVQIHDIHDRNPGTCQVHFMSASAPKDAKHRSVNPERMFPRDGDSNDRILMIPSRTDEIAHLREQNLSMSLLSIRITSLLEGIESVKHYPEIAGCRKVRRSPLHSDADDFRIVKVRPTPIVANQKRLPQNQVYRLRIHRIPQGIGNIPGHHVRWLRNRSGRSDDLPGLDYIR